VAAVAGIAATAPAHAQLLAPRHAVRLTEASLLPTNGDAGDEFGSALATGDYDGDGFRDLAVGIPGKNGGGGGYLLAFGSAGSLGDAHLVEDSVADRGGAALVLGDLDGDGNDDLVVGFPGNASQAGKIRIFFGQTDRVLLVQGSFGASDFGCGTEEAGDEFGASLAIGDFDEDAIGDLVIGIPGDDADAGALCIVKGSATRNLVGARYVQGRYVSELRESGDRYGESLAIAYNEGFDNLLVGVPSEAPGSDPAGGSAEIYYPDYGSPVGSFFTGGHAFSESAVAGESILSGERFGASLVAGGLYDDTIPEVVVGAPGEYVSSGSVYVFENLIGASGATRIDQSTALPNFVRVAGDLFGASLAIGSFDTDGVPDLVVGSPGKGVAGHSATSGLVALFPGGYGGLGPGVYFIQEDFVPSETSDAGDGFGSALAVGDFNHDHRDELVVGAPGDAVNGVAAGAVYVVPEAHAVASLLVAVATLAGLARRRVELGVARRLVIP
jgi:hypothetical protein